MSKVSVKIAVAVDVNGGWSAHGWNSNNGNYEIEAAQFAYDTHSINAKLYWLTADLDVPVIDVVNAKVMDGEDEK